MRYSNKDLDDILGKEFLVLNEGFVRVVDYMGGDSSIVQAARVSYGDGTVTIKKDRALIRYLLRNRHTSPFEMCDIKLHIKCPIFIARQWLRHRTASVNEYSARYSIMPESYYMPTPDSVQGQSKENMQGRDESAMSANPNEVLNAIRESSDNAFKVYDSLHIDQQVSRELARSVLPVGAYTEFYWKINLHNLMHFLRLRIDKHAQYEIRLYAEKILDILAIWVPSAHEAFIDYALNSKVFSVNQINAIKDLISPEKLEELNNSTELSKTELQDLKSLLSKI